MKILKVFQETNYQDVQDRVLPCTMQPWRLVRYKIAIVYPNPETLSSSKLSLISYDLNID